jgi:hypothetical protein
MYKDYTMEGPLLTIRNVNGYTAMLPAATVSELRKACSKEFNTPIDSFRLIDSGKVVGVDQDDKTWTEMKWGSATCLHFVVTNTASISKNNE